MAKFEFEDSKTTLSAPWIEHYRKIDALFGCDPDITVKYDEEEKEVKLLVKGTDKADALYALLPNEVKFGNEVLRIKICPANESISLSEAFARAFIGNPLFKHAFDIHPEGSSNAFTFVMFKPEVIQYWNDNLGDPHGIVTTLAQDLAKDVFINSLGALYSTE